MLFQATGVLLKEPWDLAKCRRVCTAGARQDQNLSLLLDRQQAGPLTER